MKNEVVVTLKSDANSACIAVLDPASGNRGRYTVYRLYRWADKRTEIIGREVDLKTARKLAGKREPNKKDAAEPSFDHDCGWRQATIKLASCVAATLRTDGKIGMGTGMVMKVKDGKRIVERWDTDFVEALAFIGIEVVDKPKRGRARREAKAA